MYCFGGMENHSLYALTPELTQAVAEAACSGLTRGSVGKFHSFGRPRELIPGFRSILRGHFDLRMGAESGFANPPNFLQLAEMARLGVCRPLAAHRSNWLKRLQATSRFTLPSFRTTTRAVFLSHCMGEPLSSKNPEASALLRNGVRN
jgi:hypothetical protein